MKLLMQTVCLVGLLLLVGKASSEEDYVPIRDECLELHNVTVEELESMKPGPEESMDESAIDMKFKCFTHCMIDKMGFLDEEGKLNVQKLEEDENVGEEDMAKAMDCKAKSDMIEDPCEYAFKLMVCALESM